jgi:hypothetical protein
LIGHGGTVDLARRIEADGTLPELVEHPVDAAFTRLFDDLVTAATDTS